jgi:amino-acid N-acetyltransferase
MIGDVRIERARPDDLAPVLALLALHDLPADGLAEHLATLLVARYGGEVVGSAALEMYADGALLRSVALAPAAQGHGVGRLLTDAALSLGVAIGTPAIYLLTTTAEAYFTQFGFERTHRAAVPSSVKESLEFKGACPASAVVMRKLLQASVSDPGTLEGLP